MASPIQRFLEGGGILVMENPATGKCDGDAILRDLPQLDGHCLFRTSGTEGEPKFVALSREALMESARSVNRRFGVTGRDRWMCVLPEFHVGGFGVFARAFLAGCEVDSGEGKWQPAAFCEALRNCGSTLTSMVPTQVFDLVIGQYRPPKSLRLAIVGGGALDPEIGKRAMELGWPLVTTYGMTETGSMMAVATGADSGKVVTFEPYDFLEGWEGRVGGEGGDGCLKVRGRALFSGYVVEKSGKFVLEDPRDGDGWFRTSDRVELTESGLYFRGRVTSEVKVLGELVDIDQLQSRVEALVAMDGGDKTRYLVLALPDKRRGHELVLADASGAGMGTEIVREANEKLAGYERISRSLPVDQIPRSALGKPLRRVLEKRLAGEE